MALFVGAARLNACHSLTDRLGGAESPIGVVRAMLLPAHSADTQIR